jgi:hypothetical protein
MKLYELDIDGETSEVFCNSIVSVPAHLKAMLKFNTDEKPMRFNFNDEKQIVTGVVISVDEPIYRYDEATGQEFNVVFRKKAADKIMLDYFKKGYANNLNLEHDENTLIKSAFLIESYQIDESRGMSVPDAFRSQDLKDGSIIFSYKVEDKQEWEEVKKRGGFSIEGVFNMVEVQTNKNEKMSLLKRLGLSQEDEKMTVEKFKQSKETFAEAETSEGIVVVWDGELNEGTEVFAEVDGVLAPVEGTHTLTGDMEGVVIEAAEGVVTSITMPEEQAKDKEEEEMAKVSEVAEAFEAMEAKYDEKLESLKSEFEAKIVAKDEEIESLKAEFAKVKKQAPAPTKEKFAGKTKEGKTAEPRKTAEEMYNILKKK